MKEQSILRIVAKLLIPYILLFALYVQFHGDYGPGGGFQAGVIFAAAIIKNYQAASVCSYYIDAIIQCRAFSNTYSSVIGSIVRI